MRGGRRRHPLVTYREVLNRWWPEVFILGLFLAVLAWPIYNDPLGQIQAWRWQYMLGLGIGTIIFSLVLLAMQKMAYVQVYPKYFKLVTPFLRLNISHGRLRRSTITEMGVLFPPAKLRGWKRKVIAPLAGRNAVIIELNSWPAPPGILHAFLSCFHFKDKTPHFVILVDDWMRYSAEMESLQHGDMSAPAPGSHAYDRSILSHLPHNNP